MKTEYKGKDIDVYEEYAKTKQEIADLEEKRKELELLVMTRLEQDGLKDEVSVYGHFYSLSRKSWEYSEEVKAKAKELSDLKKVEELKGIATIKKISSYIMLDTKDKK